MHVTHMREQGLQAEVQQEPSLLGPLTFLQLFILCKGRCGEKKAKEWKIKDS